MEKFSLADFRDAIIKDGKAGFDRITGYKPEEDNKHYVYEKTLCWTGSSFAVTAVNYKKEYICSTEEKDTEVNPIMPGAYWQYVKVARGLSGTEAAKEVREMNADLRAKGELV